MGCIQPRRGHYWTRFYINICQQLRAGGLTPIVFSYHDDIDVKLKAAFETVNNVDYDGLGFNPLRVDSLSATAHIDVASELRDIFSSIFPDLGDIQTEDIRQAIKQSYSDLGWGVGRKDLTVPSFRSFFEILRTRPKPNAGVLARLSELADYGFFDGGGERRSLLDVTEPSVVRMHGTTNAVLQQAFASFVLYSIYKDMFKRGVQNGLTHAIVFDEAHRASRLRLIPTLAKECRKYGLSLTLASQEARDFDDSLFAAIGSYLVLRVTDPDAKKLARMTVTSNVERQTIDRLKALEKYHAVFFTEGRSRPSIVKLKT